MAMLGSGRGHEVCAAKCAGSWAMVDSLLLEIDKEYSIIIRSNMIICSLHMSLTSDKISNVFNHIQISTKLKSLGVAGSRQ